MMQQDWEKTDSFLKKKFLFNTFEEAMDFMAQAAPHISALNHHPEWSNVYNTVSVTLTTHDAGNKVTDKDRQLAAMLDQIYSQCRKS